MPITTVLLAVSFVHVGKNVEAAFRGALFDQLSP